MSAIKNEPAVVEEVDTGLRTVLHGYGKVPPTYIHFIDDIQFTGGVARNVAKEQAEHLLNNTRPAQEGPDKKPYAQSKNYGRVIVHVLPNTATEGDFARITGIRLLEPKKFAAMLKAFTAEEIVAELGPDRAEQLANDLKKASNR